MALKRSHPEGGEGYFLGADPARPVPVTRLVALSERMMSGAGVGCFALLNLRRMGRGELCWI